MQQQQRALQSAAVKLTRRSPTGRSNIGYARHPRDASHSQGRSGLIGPTFHRPDAVFALTNHLNSALQPSKPGHERHNHPTV
jgi:hypothetical protein